MGWAWWVGAPITVFAMATLLSDSFYQIVKGKPSFLPFERALYKRMPATANDCVLQGAGRLLICAGVLVMEVPLFVVGALGGIQAGGLWAEHVFGGAEMACAAIALVLMVGALVIESRVHFIRLASDSKPSDLPA
jgi:hypothetical protein